MDTTTCRIARMHIVLLGLGGVKPLLHTTLRRVSTSALPYCTLPACSLSPLPPVQVAACLTLTLHWTISAAQAARSKRRNQGTARGAPAGSNITELRTRHCFESTEE